MESVKSDTPKRVFTMGAKDIEYQIPAKYYAIEILFKIIHVLIGIIISYSILYQDCLFGNCNTIPTVFFAVLALACFQSAGFPIEKLANMKFMGV